MIVIQLNFVAESMISGEAGGGGDVDYLCWSFHIDLLCVNNHSWRQVEIASANRLELIIINFVHRCLIEVCTKLNFSKETSIQRIRYYSVCGVKRSLSLSHYIHSRNDGKEKVNRNTTSGNAANSSTVLVRSETLFVALPS